MATPKPIFRDLEKLALALFCVLMIALVWAAAIERSGTERAERLAEEERDNTNLAIETAAQVQRGLGSVEQMLAVVKSLQEEGTPQSEFDRLLRQFKFDHQLVIVIGFIDARGHLAFSSQESATADSAVSPSFKYHQAHANPRLLIGKPTLGPLGQARTMSLSLRVANPDGSFGGIVFADVRPDKFAASFGKSQLTANEYVALVGEDGVIRNLHSRGQNRVGEDLSRDPLLAAHATNRDGTYRGPIGQDRVRRLVSFVSLNGYPLFVVAGTVEAKVLAGVADRRHLYQGVAALVSVFILVFACGGMLALARQRRFQARLQASETRYRTLIEQAPDAIVSCDAGGGIVGWNLAAERIFGYPASEVLAKPITLLLPRRGWKQHVERMRAIAAGGSKTGAGMGLEIGGRTKAGLEFPATVSVARWQSPQGQFFTSIIRDVSESRAAEAKTQRLSRLYRALSECNQAIVNSSNENDLFQRVCRAAVDAAGLSMACVMLVAADKQTVEPAAAFGDGVDFLRTARVTVSADEPSGRGLIGTSIRENRPQWSQDYASDARTMPWRESAARFGWASGAALPLHRDGVSVGSLFLFAGITHAFDGPVRELLVEMAADISHALNGFARQAERLVREQELRTLGRAIEHSPVSILVVGLDGGIEFANPKVEQVTGYTQEELIGQNPRLFKSGQMPAEVYRQMWATLAAGKIWHGELRNRRKDGSLFWEYASISPILDEAGQTVSYLGVKEDITERRAHEAQIEHLAFFDPLTHLPNRSLLVDRMAHALASAGRSGRPGALLFIDLDDFKTVNDTLGHEVGDQLLLQVAKRLVNCVREVDTVARLGGDEFVVMLEDLNAPLPEAVNQVEAIGEKIRTALHQPYQLVGHHQRSSASIGITFFGDQSVSVDELMKRADLAMYQAKGAGRDTLRFYDPAIQVRVMARASLESDLRRGIQERQFLLHYQPQVDAQGRVTGAEALLRWQHPGRGMVSPGEFIPLAEDTGLILPLGHWVLETACRQLAAWSASPQTRHLSLAVNVSARQFRQTDFVDQVLAVLDQTTADPTKLKLELTESMLLNNLQDIVEKMNALKARGVNFSLDDFGTGYSSLTYLKRLPLYQLKIDQSFVRDVLTDANDAAIATTIVALAKNLGLEVIAEGVETEAQRDFLARIDCHAYQGYLYSRPLGIDAFEAFVRQA